MRSYRLRGRAFSQAKNSSPPCSKNMGHPALFMQIRNEPPPPAEIEAFCERLNDITNQGGQIKLVQVYTIARNPTEHYAKRLTNDQVDAIAQAVHSRTGLSVETYYGPS